MIALQVLCQFPGVRVAGRLRYLGPRANGEAICKRARALPARTKTGAQRLGGLSGTEVGAARRSGPKLGGPRLHLSPALDGGAGSPVLRQSRFASTGKRLSSPLPRDEV